MDIASVMDLAILALFTRNSKKWTSDIKNNFFQGCESLDGVLTSLQISAYLGVTISPFLNVG